MDVRSMCLLVGSHLVKSSFEVLGLFPQGSLGATCCPSRLGCTCRGGFVAMSDQVAWPDSSEILEPTGVIFH